MENKEIDYGIYFNSKSWQLTECQIQHILEKILLNEKLNKIPIKNRKIKNKKI